MRHPTGLLGVLVLAAVGCGGSSGERGAVTPPAATLDAVQASVFTPYCAVSGCHVGASPPFGLDLSAGQARSHLVDVPSSEVPGVDRVEPGDAANSYIVWKVTGDPRITGDQMPANNPPLSAQRIQLLSEWIADGANP